jgi:hypothetical protein
MSEFESEPSAPEADAGGGEAARGEWMEGYSAAIADLEPDYDLADEQESFSSEPGLGWDVFDPDHGERVGEAVRQAVAEGLQQAFQGRPEFQQALGPRVVDADSEAELAPRLAEVTGKVFDLVERHGGEFDREAALQLAAAELDQRLQADPWVDADSALAESLVAGTQAAVEFARGRPHLESLVEAERARVGPLDRGQVAEVAEEIVVDLIDGAGIDPQDAALLAIQEAASHVSGRDWAAAQPSPETMAGYWARRIKAQKALEREAEQPKQASRSKLSLHRVHSPQALAAEWAERMHRGQAR